MPLRPKEPIQLPHNHNVYLPVLHIAHKPLQGRALVGRAAVASVNVLVANRVLVQGAVGTQLV